MDSEQQTEPGGKSRQKGVNMRKLIENLLFVVCMIYALWFTLSFLEIACKNTYKNPGYNEYNCFIITMEVLEKCQKR